MSQTSGTRNIAITSVLVPGRVYLLPEAMGGLVEYLSVSGKKENEGRGFRFYNPATRETFVIAPETMLRLLTTT